MIIIKFSELHFTNTEMFGQSLLMIVDSPDKKDFYVLDDHKSGLFSTCFRLIY